MFPTSIYRPYSKGDDAHRYILLDADHKIYPDVEGWQNEEKGYTPIQTRSHTLKYSIFIQYICTLHLCVRVIYYNIVYIYIENVLASRMCIGLMSGSVVQMGTEACR